jgi:hypothetical protein
MSTFSAIVKAAFYLGCLSVALAQEEAQPSAQVERETVVVNSQLPPYVFEIRRTAPDEATIRISGGPKSYQGQTIDTQIDEHGPRVDFVDVTFDGYQDFRVLTDESAMANESFEYRVFDWKTDKFKEAPEFDDITSVDEAHKLLITYSKGSEFEGITEYYRVEGGEPVEIKSVETAWSKNVRDIVPADYYSNDTGVQITRLYRNGKVYRTFYSKTE